MTVVAEPTGSLAVTVVDQPLIDVGPRNRRRSARALRREWLVTQRSGRIRVGNGQPASTPGSTTGCWSQRWCRGSSVRCSWQARWIGGPLPVERYALSTHEYADGTVDPHGYRGLVGSRLDGALPVWTFALADALVQGRVWMAYGWNTTYVATH